MPVKLITWNVHRGGHPNEQVPALLESEPHLIALQEIKASTVDDWRRALDEVRFDIETTVELIGDRTHGLLLASRLPMVRLTKQRVEIPFPELFMSAVITLPGGQSCELHNTHVPNGSSYGYRKMEHFEGLYRYLIRPLEPGRPRILCGDFNAPRGERRDETLITSAQNPSGSRLKPDRGQRWDAAERSVLQGLAPFGLSDVYRDVHRYTESEDNTEVSWVADNGQGRRFDHVFADPMLRPWTADYIHGWRCDDELSDHSALEFSFEAPGAG